MPLIQVVIVLIVVGVILWLINRFIPMAGHQVDPECRRGHCRCLVAPERFWSSRFALQYPRGEVDQGAGPTAMTKT